MIPENLVAPDSPGGSARNSSLLAAEAPPSLLRTGQEWQWAPNSVPLAANTHVTPALYPRGAAHELTEVDIVQVLLGSISAPPFCSSRAQGPRLFLRQQGAHLGAPGSNTNNSTSIGYSKAEQAQRYKQQQ